MSKRILFPLSVLFLSLLQACGGSDSGDASSAASNQSAPAVAPPVAADIGTVSAKFVANENMRSMLISPSRQSIGRDKEFEQADSGAVVRLGSNTLSGSHQTVDIAGNAHFALGRWLKGTVTHSSGSDTLQGKDDESHHYLAYNGLTELPTSGELQCTLLAATTPTALFDSSAKVGSASGTASISFNDSGAAIQGEMQVSAGGESAKVNLSTQLRNASSSSITGQLLANGPGAAITLADQGSEVPGFVLWYKAQLPGGALYNGVARFTCSSL